MLRFLSALKSILHPIPFFCHRKAKAFVNACDLHTAVGGFSRYHASLHVGRPNDVLWIHSAVREKAGDFLYRIPCVVHIGVANNKVYMR